MFQFLLEYEHQQQPFAEKIGNKRFVYDSYRRFIQMFADVVKGYSKFKTVSIIPGILALAPLLTLTSNGFDKSPKVFPVFSSNFFIEALISSITESLNFSPW